MFGKITLRTARVLLFIFQVLTIGLMITYRPDLLNTRNIITLAGLVLLVYIANRLLYKVSSGDRYLILIVSFLFSIGLIMIYRIDPYLGMRQLIWIIIGFIAFFFTRWFLNSLDNWDELMWLYLLVGYGLFLFTFLIGTASKGAKNWIYIGSIGFQPAEVIKICLIYITAAFYSNKSYYDRRLNRVLENYNIKNKVSSSVILIMVAYSFLALLFLQRDLGMALNFYVIFVGLQYVYEDNRKLVYLNMALFILGALIGYKFFDHVQIRFQAWIDPWKYIDHQGYQVTQGLFAIAEGGFFGTGIGLGYPNFIPEVQHDFIFAAICEEMGSFMGIGIILLFMMLVYRGFKISFMQSNKFYKILALGISISFGIQSFIILGGVLKMIPLTGITLPFISYGGTSMLVSFIALGILQKASEEIGGFNE